MIHDGSAIIGAINMNILIDMVKLLMLFNNFLYLIDNRESIEFLFLSFYLVIQYLV